MNRRQAIDRLLSRHVLWRKPYNASRSCGRVMRDCCVREGSERRIMSRTEDLNKMYRMIALNARDFIILVFYLSIIFVFFV